MGLLPNITWQEIKIKNGDIPGKMNYHQFLTYLDNIFTFGGYVEDDISEDYDELLKECYVFHVKTSCLCRNLY